MSFCEDLKIWGKPSRLSDAGRLRQINDAIKAGLNV